MSTNKFESKKWVPPLVLAGTALCVAGAWFANRFEPVRSWFNHVQPSVTAAALGLTEELTATSSGTPMLAATETPLPPVATPEGIRSAEQVAPHDQLGEQVSDMRDGWNSLPRTDLNADGVVSQDEIAASQATLSHWWTDEQRAHLDRTLVDQQVTTFEKLGELAGFHVTEPGLAQANVNWIPGYQLEGVYNSLNGGLESADVTAILTNPAHLSEALVHLSDTLAILGREKAGNGRVQSSDQIFKALTRALHLEGKWRPGVDPLSVDEIFNQCFTMRPIVAGADRVDQPESTVRADWRQLRPGTDKPLLVGEEIVTADGRHLSNDGLMVATVRLVNAEDLEKALKVLGSEGHKATVAKVTDKLSAIIMYFDYSEQSLTPAEAVDAEGIGSGGQLVECGPAKTIFEATATPVPASSTPGKVETPEVSQTPTAPKNTPEVSQTPTAPGRTETATNTPTLPGETPASETPTVTKTPTLFETLTATLTQTLTRMFTPTPSRTPTVPTNTPRPSATENPSATVQKPTDVQTMTPAPTMPGTPTQPATPTERQSTPETPVPTPIGPTETPWSPTGADAATRWTFAEMFSLLFGGSQ